MPEVPPDGGDEGDNVPPVALDRRTAHWRALLGDAHVLVSGFGRWGGGLYDVTAAEPVALDDLPTSGLAVGGDRLWRVLRAPGEQTGTCELLSYDAQGVRSYQRYDTIRDPHDVRWFAGAVHVTSSWDDAVWRIDRPDGAPTLVWQGSTVPDGWHVNSMVEVDGALHVCAFGHFDRHKAWKGRDHDGLGFVHDLRTGRDVLTGLSHPHTPRKRGRRWYVCESAPGCLTELTEDGTVRRRVRVGRFTRGLALVGPFALVGGNAHRSEQDDRAEIAVVDLRTFAVVERIPLPCLEVYDIVAVSPALARGAATGFATNAARAVDQHRSIARPPARHPAPADAAVRLATPRAAASLAAAGRTLDADRARRCGVHGTLPAAVVAGEITTWTVDVVNRTTGPLATVPPHPVKVGVRWFALREGRDEPDAGDEPVANSLAPISRILPPDMRTPVAVPVEVPEAPGRYEVRVALRQRGLGWFGVRIRAEVVVKAGG